MTIYRYVRFQSPVPNRRGHHRGVFALANGLARDGYLSDSEYALWRSTNDWCNAAYPDPTTVNPQVYDHELNPGATAWFKPSAQHLITRVDTYLQLLAAHQVPCVRLESADPGQVVYEDHVQVVAVPYPAT